MNSDVLNKPYIVEDGYPFIIVPLLLALAAGYFINAYAAVLPVLLALYFMYFFRNPRRRPPTDDSLLVSPADGTVVGIEEVDEDTYLNQKCRKVIIFLSIFDAHVNRAPLPGTIDFQQYTCGRFRPAYKDGVGYENERYSIGIHSTRTDILVNIIAGVLARRIVSWVTLGDELQHGQLYGMIRFGSCAEIYVRDNVEITVKKGDKVRGGESVIGRIVS
ncbi:MAG: phosphatidylserine decarboxylase [Megasphaera sp.]